jgi:hypothetical protein
VRNPGAYTLPPLSTLSALLYAAGGFTDNAFVRGAVLTRGSTLSAQKTELRETAARVAAGAKAGPGDAGYSLMRPGVPPGIPAFLSALQPSGRLPVRLTLPRLLKGSPEDILLEEGDVLRVPARPDTVAVAGAVKAADSAIPYAAKIPFEEYVRRAGGYAPDADREHVFLLKADGTTTPLPTGFISWNPASSRWEVTALAGGPPAVGPGDTIVVPRLPPGNLPAAAARELPGVLMRAAEIAGTPVILP